MAILQQRPTKGARISTFYPVKTLPPLASLDSAFQLQEYISLLIRLDVHDVERIVSIPGRYGGKEREGSDDMRGEEGEKEGKNDVAVDEACWIYEQLRRLSQDLSHPLITTLQQECTRQTCPEMKAGEWLYLCVAHGNDGSMEQCCAIDYILHTLDSATALLNSPRVFPSRLSIAPSSQRHFASLARRLGRIFAHAYYHHREAFEQAEAESSLYERFLALTSKFNLVPSEFLVIPPRMQAMHDERERARGHDVEPHDEPDIHEKEGLSEDHDGRQWIPIQGSSSMVDFSQNAGRGENLPTSEPQARNPSPRKGRSRTDTMVYSEAANVVEELSKAEGFSEADLDRAIAQERMLASVEQNFAEPISDKDEVEATEPFGSPDRQATIKFPEHEGPMKILLKHMQEDEPEPSPITNEPETLPQHEDKEPSADPVEIPTVTVLQAESQEQEHTEPAIESKVPVEDESAPEQPPVIDVDAAPSSETSSVQVTSEETTEAVDEPAVLPDPEEEKVEQKDDDAMVVDEVAPAEPEIELQKPDEDTEHREDIQESHDMSVDVSEADALTPETQSSEVSQESSQVLPENSEIAESADQSESSVKTQEHSE